MTSDGKQRPNVYRLPDQERYPVKVYVKQTWCNTYLAHHLYKDSISAISNKRLYQKMGSFVQECRDQSALSPMLQHGYGMYRGIQPQQHRCRTMAEKGCRWDDLCTAEILRDDLDYLIRTDKKLSRFLSFQTSPSEYSPLCWVLALFESFHASWVGGDV